MRVAGWNGDSSLEVETQYSLSLKYTRLAPYQKHIMHIFYCYLEYISVRIPILLSFRFPIITTVDVNKSIIAFTVFILGLYKPLRLVRWVWPTFSRSLFCFGFTLSPSKSLFLLKSSNMYKNKNMIMSYLGYSKHFLYS